MSRHVCAFASFEIGGDDVGQRGPAPKPTALKELQGNPGKRPLNKQEPKFDPVIETPSPPGHLNTYAKKEWNRIIPVLINVKMLTEADLAAIAVYCQSYGRWVEAEKLVKTKGLTATTDKGNVIQRPEVGIANTAMRDIVSFAKEFGMTPSSRSKIEVEDTLNKEEPFLTFIKGGKGG